MQAKPSSPIGEALRQGRYFFGDSGRPSKRRLTPGLRKCGDGARVRGTCSESKTAPTKPQLDRCGASTGSSDVVAYGGGEKGRGEGQRWGASTVKSWTLPPSVGEGDRLVGLSDL